MALCSLLCQWCIIIMILFPFSLLFSSVCFFVPCVCVLRLAHVWICFSSFFLCCSPPFLFAIVFFRYNFHLNSLAAQISPCVCVCRVPGICRFAFAYFSFLLSSEVFECFVYSVFVLYYYFSSFSCRFVCALNTFWYNVVGFISFHYFLFLCVAVFSLSSFVIFFNSSFCFPVSSNKTKLHL